MTKVKIINSFKKWYEEISNYKITEIDLLEDLADYCMEKINTLTDNNILKSYFNYDIYVSNLIQNYDYDVYRINRNNNFIKYEKNHPFYGIIYDDEEEEVISDQQFIIFKRNVYKRNNFQDYKSDKESYEGYLQYFEDKDCYGLFIKYCEGRNNIYEYVTVYGSWDNYERGYDLYQLLQDEGDTLSKSNCSVYFVVLDESIPYGKYTYKFKKGDQWIEPSENEVREKDRDGNFNNVLFVHD